MLLLLPDPYFTSLLYIFALLEQVAQGGCGCPIPGGIQGQAGCGSGQPGLLDVALGSLGNPAHSRGLKLDDRCGPFQPRLFFDPVSL